MYSSIVDFHHFEGGKPFHTIILSTDYRLQSINWPEIGRKYFILPSYVNNVSKYQFKFEDTYSSSPDSCFSSFWANFLIKSLWKLFMCVLSVISESNIRVQWKQLKGGGASWSWWSMKRWFCKNVFVLKCFGHFPHFTILASVRTFLLSLKFLNWVYCF